MWKGAAVIGGRAGGIAHQIEDGINGLLVDRVAETAERMVALLKNRPLASRLGQRAKDTVRSRFLMTRLMEDWLDLIGSFGANFKLKGAPGAWPCIACRDRCHDPPRISPWGLAKGSR